MRLISLAPSSTEIVAALGAADQLVAVTRYCDWPAEAVRTLPKIGGWTDVDETLVADYRPDLVLTSTFVQHEAEARFARLGLPVLHVDPRDLAGVVASFRQIGEAIGREREAETLAQRFKADLARIEPATAPKRLYVEEWHQPPTPSGNWVPELIERAGGWCPLLQPGEPSRAVPEEEVLAWDPEVIVLSLCGLGTLAKAELVARRPGWARLSAVRRGRVHVIDDSLLNRPGPRLVQGLATLRDLLAA